VIGPLTPSQVAAADYRRRFRWPVFASSHTVWLRLPADLAAISVIIPNPDRARLLTELADAAGPLIDYTHGHYALLTRCTTVDPDHLGTGRRDDASGDGRDQDCPRVAHLGVNELIDLPPSVVTGRGVATWLREPDSAQQLPNCARLLTIVRRLLDHSA
jgi:hypothetical protein